MTHECENCGQMCACDMEDLEQEQPNDCKHFASKYECDMHEDWEDDEDLSSYARSFHEAPPSP